MLKTVLDHRWQDINYTILFPPSPHGLLNICYSPAGRSVLGKTVPEVLDTARGRRPRAVSKTEGTVFPNTDRPSAGE